MYQEPDKDTISLEIAAGKFAFCPVLLYICDRLFPALYRIPVRLSLKMLNYRFLPKIKKIAKCQFSYRNLYTTYVRSKYGASTVEVRVRIKS